MRHRHHHKNPSTIKKETLGVPFALLAGGVPVLETGEFEGMASVFNTPINSYVPTIIEPGAFKKTLAERGDRVKILYQHNDNQPIGRPTLLEETAKGLKIRGKIVATDTGKEALMLMREGILDSLSIGFDPVKWDMQEHDDGQMWRHLQEVRLWEVSVVTFPANSEAIISDVNSTKKPAEAHTPIPDAVPETMPPKIVPSEAQAISGSDAAATCAECCDEMQACLDIIVQMIASGTIDLAKLGYVQAKMEDCIADMTEMADEMKASNSATMNRTEPAAETLSVHAESLTAPALELHEGKVLSAKNLQIARDAVAMLQKLIDAAEPPDADKNSAVLLTVDHEQILRDAKLALAQSTLQKVN